MSVYYFYEGQDPNRKSILDSILDEYYAVQGREIQLTKSDVSEKKHVTEELRQIDNITPFCRGLIDIETISSMIEESEDTCGEKIILYIKDGSDRISGIMIFTFDYYDESGNWTNSNDFIYIHYLCTPFAGGFGKILMQVCQEIGKRARAKQIKLLSTPPAVSFYKHMGFHLIPESELEYNKKAVTARPRSDFVSRVTSSVFSSFCMPRRVPKRKHDYEVYEMVYKYPKRGKKASFKRRRGKSLDKRPRSLDKKRTRRATN
jgi:hypothetical protein